MFLNFFMFQVFSKKIVFYSSFWIDFSSLWCILCFFRLMRNWVSMMMIIMMLLKTHKFFVILLLLELEWYEKRRRWWEAVEMKTCLNFTKNNSENKFSNISWDFFIKCFIFVRYTISVYSCNFLFPFFSTIYFFSFLQRKLFSRFFFYFYFVA
jgi:hypothetical protein